MAKRKKSKGRKRHVPTTRAKKAYYGLIIKSYHRLKRVVSKHAPNQL